MILSPMHRLFAGLILFLGILVIPLRGIGFAPVEDVSPTILLGEILWLDADGNGITDAIAVDVQRNELVARLRYSDNPDVITPANAPIFIELGGPSGSLGFYGIKTADLNKDGFEDIYSQVGQYIHWWGGSETGLTYQGIWYLLIETGAPLSIIADIDADGNLDLVFGRYSRAGSYEIKEPSKIGFGDGTGGYKWVEYPQLLNGMDTSLAGCDRTINLEGDIYPDLLTYSSVIRFVGREMVDVLPLTGLQITKVPDFQHDVFIKSTVGQIDVPEEYSLVQYNPTVGWIQIGDSTPAANLFNDTNARHRGLYVIGGIFDAGRITCAAIITEFDTGFLPQPTIPITTLIKFEDSRLKVYSSIYSPGLLGGSYSRSIRSDGESDLLIKSKNLTTATDLFENQIGVSSGLTEGIIVDPNFSVFAISRFHETRSLAFVPAQQDSASVVLSAGGRDQRVLSWTDTFSNSVPESMPIDNPALSIMAGRQTIAGTTSIFLSTVNGLPATNGQSLTFKEAREQTLSSQNGVSVDSSGYFPQHLIGVSDLDLDGVMDIIYIDPTNGALVSGPDLPSPGAGGDGYLFKKQFIASAAVPFKWDIPRAQTLDNTVLYDVDGDGDDDILRFPSIYGHRIGIHWNDGGKFSRSQPIGMEIEGFPQGIFTGKFTGTEMEIGVVGALEDPDSFDAHIGKAPFKSSLVIFSMQGELLQQVGLPLSTEKVVPGDLNGDGLDDLIVDIGGIYSDRFREPVTNEGFSILRNMGAGFSEPASLSVPQDPIVSILVEDIDSDGLDDLVLGDKHGRIMYFKSIPQQYASENYAGWALRLNVSSDGKGDADGDGDPDLIEYLSGSDPHVSGDTGAHGIRPKMGIELDIYDAVSVLEDESKPFVGNVLSSVNFAIRTDRGADKVRIGIERSSNLSDWELIENLGNGFLLPGQAGWSLIDRNEIRLGNASQGGDFYRVRADLIVE